MKGKGETLGEAEFDLLIVGGGIVGASLACALASTPLRIAVIEARPLLDPPLTPDGRRVSALTLGSVRLLERIGVWSALPAGGTEPIYGMRIWDRGQPGGLDFDGLEVGADRLGDIVPNDLLAYALQEKCRHAAGIEWLSSSRWWALQRRGGRVKLGVETPSGDYRLSAPLLVGADGGGSKVRREMGIGVCGWPYRQTTIVAEVEPLRPHHNRAYQRFLRGGPVALLPLPQGRCSLIWHAPEARAEGLLDLERESFLRQFQRAFGPELGTFREVRSRLSFPLHFQHTQRYWAHRVALIGDAAHTIHPLAGLGLNLGLRDAAQLAEILAQAYAVGEDLGARTVLSRYERARIPDNWLVSAYTDGFHRLFTLDFRVVNELRNLGINLVNTSGLLKEFLINQGIEGMVPRSRLAQRKALVGEK